MTAPSRYLNVMVDIETMGHGPSAPVLAVGLVPFQIHPNQCELAPRDQWREVRCSLAANVVGGKVINADTVEWWLRQDKAAQELLLAEPRHATLFGFWSAVREEILAVNSRSGDLSVWAKPPQYDLITVRESMLAEGVDVPWQHRNEQDLRTVVAIARAAMQSGQAGWQEVFEVKPVVEHSAMADAAEQAEQVVRFYRRLYRR
jgi:hypothetical protein